VRLIEVPTMKRIEIAEDAVQPARVTFGQTLLRVVLGLIFAAHGVERLLAIDSFKDELALRFAMLEPGTVAHALLAIELFGGVFLMLGWFTRIGAFALLCSAAGSIWLEVMRQGGFVDPRGFELPALLASGAFYYLLAGPGPASLDIALRERARRKAIENDDLWLSHPYVGSNGVEDPSFDDDLEYAPERFNGRLAQRR
jgi:putative oxidoreductase